RDNYLQTQALSLAEAQAAEILPAHARCIQMLEKTGLLNRAVEYLPDDAEIADRQKLGKGLTRPELAVLLSYAKIWLYQKILDSSLPDDAALHDDITDYFPKAVREKYAGDIAKHRLRREIAATVVANDMVNRAGMQIILTVAAHPSADAVARAYLLAREAFGLPDLWAKIETLDNKIPAAAQTRMDLTVCAALAAAIERFVADKAALGDLKQSIAIQRKGQAALRDWLSRHGDKVNGPVAALRAALRDQGVPEELARRAAYLPALTDALDLTALAAKTRTGIADLAGLFFGLAKRFDIGWLRHLQSPAPQTAWQCEAVSRATDELMAHHRRLIAQFAAKQGGKKKLTIEAWAARNGSALDAYDALLAEGRAAGGADLALLLLANERLAALSV
ncbi:MAG: NAD-glutamate dehydrogenase, partial [Alphaproteobacteria bacterium]|nr:NAD-glutamate dehydrogenase [Alphaproteobacteria bacterium]